MTAKTHGYITKEIELEQIYQFVLKYFDPEAKVNRYENRFGESNEMAVYFTYKGEEVVLAARSIISIANGLNDVVLPTCKSAKSASSLISFGIKDGGAEVIVFLRFSFSIFCLNSKLFI